MRFVPILSLRLRSLSARRVAAIAAGILVVAAILGSSTNVAVPASRAAPRSTYSPQAYLPFVSSWVRPNIVLIISDDQRYDTMDYMPLTRDQIFAKGLTFERAYITTPLCCPSRSSILTGQYAHHHQVLDNTTQLMGHTFVQDLHNAGYYTGLVGKYLNSWSGEARPEFDYWVAPKGTGTSQQYFDPLLNVNGVWIQHHGYKTYILRDYALNFLSLAKQRPAPFLLIFTPNAPHEPADPAPGDENLYPNLPLYRPPSFMEADMSDKPKNIQSLPPVNPDYIDALRRKQLQTLHSLDLAIDQLLSSLTANGQEANTVVIFLSDNGVFWAEHRLNGKVYGYEEATHVPFAIRYGPMIAGPRVETRLVANIDIAPTIYDLAGLAAPSNMDGVSLLPLMRSQTIPWRTSLLIEGRGSGPLDYKALQTDRYLYIETQGNISELYDATTDPYQIQNQASNPAYAATVNELHNLLAQYPLPLSPAPSGSPAVPWNDSRLDD
jgi:N-acetylglucosamine-6-sulfatase